MAASPLLAATLLLAAVPLCAGGASAAGLAAAASQFGARAALNLTLQQQVGFGQDQRGYSTNSLCRQNNCINPVFPGLNDLPRLEALQWQCATHGDVRDYMDFCKDVVIYDPALPSPVKKAKPIDELVKAQEDAAMTMFAYHLSGMGYEAWDYRAPGLSDSDCVRSVWKMVCFTYFPRAEAGCEKGQQSLYKRPCHSCCKNYMSACAVECCDESVQCTFAHTKTEKDGKPELVQTGYVDADGPSASCTGAARRAAGMPIALLLALVGFHGLAGASSGASSKLHSSQPHVAAVHKMAVKRAVPWRAFVVMLSSLALLLQGCGLPTHEVGNWRAEPNYLTNYGVIPEGKSSQSAVLNSCTVPGLSPAKRCSGRGYCAGFTSSSLAAQAAQEIPPLAFCNCDQGWADPECGTRRKSQWTAFMYSLFLGFLGADYFYLGFPLWGMAKLSCPLFGAGLYALSSSVLLQLSGALVLAASAFWWVVDILRIASGPVYAFNFRTASDLSHWLAMLVILSIFMLLGFFAAIETYLVHRKQKRADIAFLEHAEESERWKRAGKKARTSSVTHGAGSNAYGAALPQPAVGPFGPGGWVPPALQESPPLPQPMQYLSELFGGLH